MNERKKVIRWIKTHRKALVIAGISITALIAIIMGIKNRQAIKQIWMLLRAKVEKPVAQAIGSQPVHVKGITTEEVISAVTEHREVASFDVSKHIRNLPYGRHASAEKIATALENGFVLSENQTWVVDYAKGMAA